MILLSGLVGVLLVLTAEAGVGKSSPDNFCTETKECLTFEKICETDDYEVRHYGPVKWVSTKEESWSMDYASMKAFGRLFNYISGENAEGKKIEMTAPVVVDVPDKWFWEKGIYTMSFLLPSDHQSNPPMPTDKEVYIHESPDMKVYVQSYGGWMTCVSDGWHAHSLCESLDMADAKYDKDIHYGVGYNSPMALFNRHNEVWYVVKGEPMCTSSSEEIMLN
ncbi:heme-binding protein 2 [Notolabrus celidotus]|uniref:heme-binding protein 2 n=1 Tax=Notolabrus celidotus TaxID=1203425 RepID=UPI00148F7342|nr:heme-binding protein 2 [Notolabrus celidotus]XP_034566715.1 heme-binding protein 2 [Notolabrus celidotus]